jgi:hypothetical protein
MGCRKFLTIGAMVCTWAGCAVSFAHAEPLADSQGGPLTRAEVPRIALDDDTYLPRASLNEQIIRVPVDA